MLEPSLLKQKKSETHSLKWFSILKYRGFQNALKFQNAIFQRPTSWRSIEVLVEIMEKFMKATIL